MQLTDERRGMLDLPPRNVSPIETSNAFRAELPAWSALAASLSKEAD